MICNSQLLYFLVFLLSSNYVLSEMNHSGFERVESFRIVTSEFKVDITVCLFLFCYKNSVLVRVWSCVIQKDLWNK